MYYFKINWFGTDWLTVFINLVFYLFLSILNTNSEKKRDETRFLADINRIRLDIHRRPVVVVCCPSDVGIGSTKSLWFGRLSPPPFYAKKSRKINPCK